MKIARALKLAVPLAAAIGLMAATPAFAIDQDGCNAYACGGVTNYRYSSVGGGLYEIWIDQVVVSDLRAGDGVAPVLRINYTSAGGLKNYVVKKGKDDGDTSYLGSYYNIRVKNVYFQICGDGPTACVQLS
jgi:hypothetical protein